MSLPLVLASTSSFRRDLLTRLQITFIQDSPQTDETPLVNETAPQLAQRLSIAKAQALADKYPQHLIIGSDQVAMFAGQLIGKPLTHDNAVQQLRLFSGQCVYFYTGLCVFNSQTRKCSLVLNYLVCILERLVLNKLNVICVQKSLIFAQEALKVKA
jgi:MAF protein